nr:hypothetical protein Iba_chr05fCG7220 [Ipomoea batatas]
MGLSLNLRLPTPELYPLVDMKRASSSSDLRTPRGRFTPGCKDLEAAEYMDVPKVRSRARRANPTDSQISTIVQRWFWVYEFKEAKPEGVSAIL